MIFFKVLWINNYIEFPYSIEWIFFEWIFWILFLIESFFGPIQWKNEFSERIAQGYFTYWPHLIHYWKKSRGMYKHFNQEHYGEHWMQLRVQSSSPPRPVHARTPSNKMSNTSKISKKHIDLEYFQEEPHCWPFCKIWKSRKGRDRSPRPFKFELKKNRLLINQF